MKPQTKSRKRVKKLTKLDQTQINTLVIKLRSDIEELFKTNLSDIHGTDRFIIMGRVVNSFFAGVYLPSIEFGKDQLDQATRPRRKSAPLKHGTMGPPEEYE